MKKIFANIFIVVLIVAPVGQSMAQMVQKRAVKPAVTTTTTHKVTRETKTVKPGIKTVVVKKAPETKAVKPEAKPVTAKPVSDKIKEEEKRVAAAKQAHELKIAKQENKVVTTAPIVEEEETAEKPDKKYDSTLCFPLKRDNIYSLYTFVIDLRDQKIISKFKPFFDRNNYEFTGYVWQGLLKQIINNADDKINHNVFIKAEDNLVCFTITNYDVKTELPEYICPILSSPKLFASYVRKANREDIHNY